MMKNMLRSILPAFLLGSILWLSGCAMLLLGGTAGYLIRKGEEGGGGETRSTSTSQYSNASEQKAPAY